MPVDGPRRPRWQFGEAAVKRMLVDTEFLWARATQIGVTSSQPSV